MKPLGPDAPPGLDKALRVRARETFFQHRISVDRAFEAAWAGRELVVGPDQASLLRVLDHAAPSMAIRGLVIDGATVEALVAKTSVADVRALRFTGSKLGTKGLSQLAGWAALGQIEILGLASVDMTDEGLEALLRSPHLGAVTHLDLGFNSFGPTHLAALGKVAPRLRVLDLKFTPVGDEGLAALAASSALDQLTELGLCACKIGEAGITALGHLAGMPSLALLDLIHSGANAVAVRALATSPHRRSLRELSFAGSPIGPEGVEVLARESTLCALENLSISMPYNAAKAHRLDDRAALAIAGATRLASLRALDMSWNEITDRGATALAQGTALRDLQWLSLNVNEIGSDGARALIESTTMTELRELQLLRNKLGKKLAGVKVRRGLSVVGLPPSAR